MLHGSGGVLPARELTYGRQFAALGMVALAVDSFAARREMGTGFVDRLLNITETMLVADAFAALHFLAQRTDVDPRRVVLIGFSYGGIAAQAAMNAGLAARLARGPERFAAHAAYYGPCIGRFADPRTTGAPLLMQWGDQDELMIPARCEEAADAFRRAGSQVEMIVYRGAAHQWDGGWGPRRIGRLLGDCDLRLEADGTVTDMRTGLRMAGAFTRRLILGWCTEDRPYLLAADEAVRARSNAALAVFLDRALGTRLASGRADRLM
jgi:dienelactone hydrolase